MLFLVSCSMTRHGSDVTLNKTIFDNKIDETLMLNDFIKVYGLPDRAFVGLVEINSSERCVVEKILYDSACIEDDGVDASHLIQDHRNYNNAMNGKFDLNSANSIILIYSQIICTSKMCDIDNYEETYWIRFDNKNLISKIEYQKTEGLFLH